MISVEKAIAFQREIETRGFVVGGDRYDLPAMNFGKFVNNKNI